jgi:molybdopterin converting factor small subunit
MRIKVTISRLLRHLSQLSSDLEALEVEAPNAVECLRATVERFPSMNDWMYETDGTIRPQVWFFVNGEKLADDERDKALKDGDELLIFFHHV